MTQLDKETLTHLTRLCRIHCSAEELERFLSHLQAILNYSDQLKEVDTENVSISTHITEPMETVMREDVIEASLDRDLFLRNAPSHISGMVRVPTVIQF